MEEVIVGLTYWGPAAGCGSSSLYVVFIPISLHLRFSSRVPLHGPIAGHIAMDAVDMKCCGGGGNARGNDISFGM